MTPNADHTPQAISWDQLLDSISSASSHPDDTQWMIYRYMSQNLASMDSIMARTLLSAYIKLHRSQPSALNSCMLVMAVKVSKAHADFRFPQFLQAWGYPQCLTEEDKQPQKGKDGKQYLSLHERVERARLSYMLHHPEESRDGCKDIVSMYAVKTFEKLQNGRKCRYVKLVGADGMSFVADSRQFGCKPWEITGRMYDVLVRQSKQGNGRAEEIVQSTHSVADVFPVETGYVEGIDDSHGHVHVFDAQSRHFVAGKETLRVRGVENKCFIRFCPIIAQGDPFKSAAVVNVLSRDEGRKTFGAYEATVEYVNEQEGYLRYQLVSSIKPTPEGTITEDGFASLSLVPEEKRKAVAVGQRVRLTLFLKRGKDGVKRNHVAEIY